MKHLPKALNTIIGDGGLLLFESFARGLGTFVALSVLARNVSTQDFGLVNFWLVIMAAASRFVAMGLGTLIFPRVIKAPILQNGYINTIFSIRLLLWVFSALLVTPFLFFLSPSHTIPVIIIGMVLLAEIPMVHRDIIAACGNIKLIALGGLLYLFYVVSICVYLFANDNVDWLSGLLAIAFARIILGFYYFLIGRGSPSSSLSVVKLIADWRSKIYRRIVILKSVSFIFLGDILSVLSTGLLVIVLGALSITEELGYYAAAMRVYMLMIVLPSVFSNAYYRYLANMDISPRNMVFWGCSIYSLSFLIAFPICFAFRYDIMSLLFGKEFARAGDALLPLLFAALFFSFRSIYNKRLIASDNMRFIAVNSLILFLVMAIFIVICIFIENYELSFWSLTFSEIVVFCAVVLNARQRKAIFGPAHEK